jgi:hypothetical protein
MQYQPLIYPEVAQFSSPLPQRQDGESHPAH